MLEFLLPTKISRALNAYPFRLIFEIRFRDGKPAYINEGGNYHTLKDENGSDIYLDYGECERILAKATEFSLYAVNNQIVRGFLTVQEGVRIGVCGEVVTDNGVVKSIRHCNSLNIRVPHEVVGCGKFIYDNITDVFGTIKNTLIISAPGRGKTTILRDIARLISLSGKNVLLVDERRELASVSGGKPFYEVGCSTDVISSSDKNYAFSYAIRSMAPNVIITDEIQSESDAEAIKLACSSGVKVVASIHAGNIAEYKSKNLSNLLSCIDLYVILKSNGALGVVESMYDKNFEDICLG